MVNFRVILLATTITTAAALGSSSCEVTGCDVNNTAYYEFNNESTEDMELFIDGESIAEIAPGESEAENIEAGVEHVIEFKWEDGQVACLDTIVPVQCDTRGLTCDAPPP